MYIWIGLVLSKEDNDFIRSICKEINKNYNLDEASFTLPQHVSLKSSFYIDNYNEVVDYIKKLLSNISPFRINITGISKINNSVIWLDIEETQELRNIHNMLNDELLKKFNIPLIKHDGDIFRFHSTLFLDENISNEHDELVKELLDRFKLPIEFDINEINIGISPVEEVDAFKVYDKIEL